MPEPTHGTRTGYQAGCHCRACAAANARYQADWRSRVVHQRPAPTDRIPAGASRELLRRLSVAGFSEREIARRFGLKGLHFRHHGLVTRRTQARVALLWHKVTTGGDPDEGD
jgi:hypothetical protein